MGDLKAFFHKTLDDTSETTHVLHERLLFPDFPKCYQPSLRINVGLQDLIII